MAVEDVKGPDKKNSKYKKVIYVRAGYGSTDIVMRTYREMAAKYNVSIHFLCIPSFIYPQVDWSFEHPELLDRKMYTCMSSLKSIIWYIARNCKKDTVFVFPGRIVGRKVYVLQMIIMLFGGHFICEVIGAGIGVESDNLDSLPEKSMYDYIKPECFFASTINHIQVKSKRALRTWPIVYTCGWNYLRYLELQQQKNCLKLPYQYALFIDENLPYHFEAEIMHTRWVEDVDAYFKQLNMLFVKIKEQMGLDTVIALHPSASQNRQPYHYKARDSFIGKTLELVSGASFVILYGCSSIDFVILYKKPLLIYTSKDLERCNANTLKSVYRKKFNEAFAFRSIPIDNMREGESVKEYIYYDETAYKQFIEKYLKPQGGKTHYDAIFSYIKYGDNDNQKEDVNYRG